MPRPSLRPISLPPTFCIVRDIHLSVHPRELWHLTRMMACRTRRSSPHLGTSLLQRHPDWEEGQQTYASSNHVSNIWSSNPAQQQYGYERALVCNKPSVVLLVSVVWEHPVNVCFESGLWQLLWVWALWITVFQVLCTVSSAVELVHLITETIPCI
jgi:hypothetical protein